MAHVLVEAAERFGPHHTDLRNAIALASDVESLLDQIRGLTTADAAAWETLLNGARALHEALRLYRHAPGVLAWYRSGYSAVRAKAVDLFGARALQAFPPLDGVGFGAVVGGP